MRLVPGITLAIATSLTTAAGRLVLPSNSTAATRSGVRQYSDSHFATAARYFADASTAKSGTITDYNLGTAQLAAGDRGAATESLERAAEGESVLAAAALYNLGTDALEQKNTDAAIARLTQSLMKNPLDRNAKRNLELALRKREEEQQQQNGTGGGGDEDGQQQAPAAGEQPGDADGADTALRSVEQQDREELSRMRRSGARPRRIGW